MKIASFVSNIPTMDDTRTYEDFYKYLGDKPTRLGVVTRMYPQNTATFITESLKNIFYLDAKGSGNKYQSVNSLYKHGETKFFKLLKMYTSNIISSLIFLDEVQRLGEIRKFIIEKLNYYEIYNLFNNKFKI